MLSNSSEIQPAEIEKMARASDAASFASLLGMKTMRADRGYALTSMTLSQEKHLNFLGLTHGAVLFALADHACSICGNSLGPKAVLIQSSINFLSNPRPGNTIEAEARMVDENETAGILDIVVRDANEKILVRCQSIVLFMDPDA